MWTSALEPDGLGRVGLALVHRSSSRGQAAQCINPGPLSVAFECVVLLVVVLQESLRIVHRSGASLN